MIGHHARLKEKELYFVIELSLREISFVVYVHALIYNILFSSVWLWSVLNIGNGTSFSRVVGE